MQAMLDFAVRTMKTGAVMLVETVEAGRHPEGRYGDPLERDRRRASNSFDRLLSILQGRTF